MSAQPGRHDLAPATGWVLAHARKAAGAGTASVDLLNEAVSAYLQETGAALSLPEQRAVLAAATAAITPARALVPALVPVAKPAVGAEKSAHVLAYGAEVMETIAARVDFATFNSLSATEKTAEIRSLVQDCVREKRWQLNSEELDLLAGAVIDDMLGYGPLQALLADDSVTDIMVNGAQRVFVERGGHVVQTGIVFRDDAHVLNLAQRIVAAVGRRIDESQPLVDARLKDGSRVNIVIPPLAIDGPAITIRKFPARALRLEDLVKNGALTRQMADFLGLAAKIRLNVLISGGTGSGKTTLLNALSGCIARDERIVTLEDAAELQLQQDHVVRFETRPPNIEGRGEITMRSLLRNALRMRPDRIIIGEIRGAEALDLLQAMNTGHDGSMSTLHANSPREALTRVEGMCALSGFTLQPEALRQQLAHAVHLVIQVARMRDGKRRVTAISEIVGMETGIVTLQEIFTFAVSPASTRSAVLGDFVHTGYRPMLAARAAEYGLARDLDTILRG